ncbi:hypothetical protein FRC07_003332 [Ceratobasidium sp. 392]|nr:hypothetical protein FRC07_003332 [Ceratobasidium sp. 392]
MPPKGSEKAALPEFVKQTDQPDEVCCMACGNSAKMKRKNLARHLESAGHKDSFRIYEANKRASIGKQLQQSRPVGLNPPLPAQPTAPIGVPGAVPSDTSYLDINNIDKRDYSDVQFSAGESENLGLSFLLRSCAMDQATELDPDTLEAEEEEFPMPLPQRILRDLAAEELSVEALQERFFALKQSSSWGPHRTKIMLLLDLLDNIPRLRLSAEHLKLIMWVMEEAGCPNMPTFSALRETQKQLRKVCAIKSHQYRSSQGNVFEMLDIPELIGRDFSNPLIAPYVVKHPEDSGGKISEPWQAKKWRDDIPLEHLTPTYADGGKMYYVNELARLHNGSYVIPKRWITRDGQLTADCWPVHRQSIPGNEGETGLRVDDEIIHVPSSAFASNYYDLVEHAVDPSSYKFAASSKPFEEKMPNPLRKLAGNSEELISCFIKPWCDDVSGGRTKQYQPHNNIYLNHANLPGHLLNQEFCVRFASTATHASSTEQFEAIKKQLDANNENPIRVYNAATGRYVRLRIYVLNVPADNRAQSEIASHVCGGNFPCRKCNVGGTYKETETEDGFKSFFQPGQPRTTQETVRAIWEQINKACLGVESHVLDLQTKSGVKDPTAQGIITQLIEKGRELKKQLKQPGQHVDDKAIMQAQSDWLRSQPSLPFNVLFQINGTPATHNAHVSSSLQPGLDPHRDTPVEILHTILLGVEKYTWYLFHSSTKPDVLKTFQTRLLCADVSGLEMDPVRAEYIVRFKNNLIGRHLKALMQLSVFQIFDLVSVDLFSLTKVVGDLGAMLWYSEIPDLDSYLADLSILINNVLDAFAKLDPNRVITKLKLHILTHLVEDIRNHGPAVRYATEVFECYNGVFREISLHSKKDRKTLKWQDTVGGKAGTTGLFFTERDWLVGESVVAANGDECEVGSWVVASHSQATIIGRVQEILLDADSGSHGLVTIDQFDVAEDRHRHLGMPVLVHTDGRVNNTTVLSSYTIDFAINVQHNCMTLGCPNSAVEFIRQERLNTTLERQIVKHRDEAVYIINMHALHNARRIREVLPRRLTEPIPLRSTQDREGFLATAARQLHERQRVKREETARKRKAARTARENEAHEAEE